MSELKQIIEDTKLLKRVQIYGKGLNLKEIQYIDSFMAWVVSGKILTPAQRRCAEAIDQARVD